MSSIKITLMFIPVVKARKEQSLYIYRPRRTDDFNARMKPVIMAVEDDL